MHSGLLQVPSTVVAPEQLFNYLLDHERTYGMAVIRWPGQNVLLATVWYGTIGMVR